MNPIGKMILENCDNELRFDVKAHMRLIRERFAVSTFAVEVYADKIGVTIVGRYRSVGSYSFSVPSVRM